MRRFLLASLVALAVPATAPAQDPEPPEPATLPLEEVRECMERNQPKLSAVQTVSLKSRYRTGAEKESRATVYWQRDEDDGSKVLLRFFSPPDMRGAGLLVLEEEDRNDMFMYLPEVGRVRRVTKHMAGGSMFGTDFTYEDFERIQGIAQEGEARRLPDAEVDGRAVYVIEGEPPEENGRSEERSVVYVDRETCLVSKMEFYERGDRLRRVISTDVTDAIEASGLRVPREIQARDLRDDSQSSLIFEKIEIDETLPRKTFTVRWLEAGRD